MSEDIQIRHEIGEVSNATRQQRERINMALHGSEPPLLGIQGPCAMLFRDMVDIADEGSGLRTLPTVLRGLVTAHRIPPWKPRSDPTSWPGEESTNPEGVMSIMDHQAKTLGNVAIEIGKEEHVSRYSHLLSFAWIGARNVYNSDLMDIVALSDPTLPLGVKNFTDGTLDVALNQIKTLRKSRGSDGAEVVLIYRGGTNAKSPEAWEEKYIEAFERTEGKLIVDTAHGGEMAHDPAGLFTKSVIGQIICAEHVLLLAEAGIIPAGIIQEASNAEQVIDPHMPFTTGVENMQKLTEFALASTANQHHRI